VVEGITLFHLQPHFYKLFQNIVLAHSKRKEINFFIQYNGMYVCRRHCNGFLPRNSNGIRIFYMKKNLNEEFF
jgi:hypothetical protein